MSSDVIFEFYDSDEGILVYEGQLVQKPEGMTLDIPPQGGSAHYLVNGKLRDTIFEGRNSMQEPNAPNVIAKWVKLDNRCVGTWVEDGNEYVFWFDVQ